MSDILARIIETEAARTRFLDEETFALFAVEKTRALGLFDAITHRRKHTDVPMRSHPDGIWRHYQSIPFGTQVVFGEERDIFIEPTMQKRDPTSEFPIYIALSALTADSKRIRFPRSQHGYAISVTGAVHATLEVTEDMGRFGVHQSDVDTLQDFNTLAEAVIATIQE
jgi:hypothetical protein